MPTILQKGELVTPENQWKQSAMKVPAGAGRSALVEVHLTVGISADSAGNLTPHIEKVSSNQAVKVVQQAAPAIVNASVQKSVDANGAALAGGAHDKAMARYGAKAKAIPR